MGSNKKTKNPQQSPVEKTPKTNPKKTCRGKGHLHAVVYLILSVLVAHIAFVLPALSPSVLEKSKQIVSRVPIPAFVRDFLPDSPAYLYKQHYSAFYTTPESVSALETAKKAFLSSPDGKFYGYGKETNEKLFNVEKIVAKETKRFANNLYFDYTGSGVYQEKQVRLAQDDLLNGMFGNAHSENPSSSHTGVTVEDFRDRVLKHFNVTAGEYSVIFTSGATGALKLIAESFPWTDRSRFVYLLQDHNSVLGIREVALDQGAQFMAIPESEMADDSCNELFGGTPCGSESEKSEPSSTRGKSRKNVLLTDFPEHTYNLFAFPAEENFAGVKYPLEWINLFHERSRGEKGTGNWLVLLDAAAYVPTNTLDLHKYPADFVSVSFYKMFGYPTGLGVLLVRNSIVDVMQKTFFGGGTVSMSSSDRHFCMLAQNPCSKFEDGTINFLSIAEAEYGFRALEELTHSPAAADMSAVTEHVWGLTHWLYNELKNMKHSNGRPVFKIYGKHNDKDAHDKQGGIINLSVLNKDGSYVGYHTVQELTSKKNVHIRTGCNCNPGACYDYLGVSSDEVIDISLSKTSCHDDVDMTKDGRPLGAVRISLGYLTTFEDVHAFSSIMRELFAH